MDQPPPEPTPAEPDPAGGGPDWAALRERIGTLSAPDRILMVASIGYFVSTFLPWYEASIGPGVSVSDGAWNVGALGIMAALLGLGTAVVTVPTALGIWRIGRESSALLTILLAPATLFFTFLRLVIDPPGAAVTQFTFGFVKVSRGFGLWAALVLAIVMTVGAVQKFREAAALR
ncbi:MAG: hypothetical protein WEB06_16050 [Actinomycetota bacterium]